MKFLKIIASHILSSVISVIGVALTTVSAVMLIISFLLSVVGEQTGPYQGLISYTLFPFLFVLGLLLIPLGIYFNVRSKRRSGEPITPFMFDLSNPIVRRGLVLFAVLTILNSIILSIALYKGYHYTDSTAFCGTLCHTVMEPEYTAYQHSPHARVSCSECHIGSGASWFVKSKLSGLRQVAAVIFDTYQTPIPSPVEDLRPARETCEQCHWPKVFHGKKLNILSSLDENASVDNPIITALVMNIGGLNTKTGVYDGIHWHVSEQNRVEYLASDKKRQTIKKVRSYKKDGSVREYVRDDVPDPPADAHWRVMDCIDCHNRPTHIYDDPQRAIDRALIQGKIDATLPDIRNVAMKTLTHDYPSRTDVQQQMQDLMTDTYRQSDPELVTTKQDAIQKVATELADIYKRNVFPDMKVTFNTYPNQLNHRNDKGCFRCHDEEHKTASGQTISQECTTCHEFLVMEENLNDISDEIKQLIQ